MIYVFLANGFEETEAVAPIDMLRRSEKEVVTVGVGGDRITSSHGLTVFTDIVDSDVLMSDKIEMIVLPGGMPGTLNLEKSPVVNDAIKYCAENGKYIGAICAAPSILGKLGLLNGKKATCFPGFEKFLEGAVLSDELVCTDGNIITAKGAGAATEFGLELSRLTAGQETSDSVKAAIQCR